MSLALLVASLLGGTEPPRPFVNFGLRAEAMGSLAVSPPVTGGGAARVGGILDLGDHFDVLLSAGFVAVGASMFTLGAGVGVHRSLVHTLVIPGGDFGLGYAALGSSGHLALSAGTSLLLRGDDRWPLLLGPAVRFEYLVGGVAVLSFGLSVEFVPGAVVG